MRCKKFVLNYFFIRVIKLLSEATHFSYAFKKFYVDHLKSLKYQKENQRKIEERRTVIIPNKINLTLDKIQNKIEFVA